MSNAGTLEHADSILAAHDGGSPCRFCDFAEREQPVLTEHIGVAVPSIGAMLEGWMLVVPRRHTLSLSQLRDDEWIEFTQLVDRVTTAVTTTWGPTVAFEHGALTAGRAAGCGVDHAHLHVLPLRLDLRALVAKISDEVGEFHWRRSGRRPQPRTTTDYLQLHDHTGSWLASRDVVPSQVFRRAIAHHLGEEVWNWRSDPRSAIVNKTRQKWPVP